MHPRRYRTADNSQEYFRLSDQKSPQSVLLELHGELQGSGHELQPDERTMFTLGMYGKGDFFDMKGVCEEFFEKIGMKKKVKSIEEVNRLAGENFDGMICLKRSKKFLNSTRR